MTLSTQNKILLIFSIVSSVFCALFFVGIIFFLIHTTPQNFFSEVFDNDFSVMSVITEKDSLFVILSLLVLSIYVPVVGFIVYIAFEKTNSSEVIFFIAVLLGFFAETFRLAIPIFNLAETYTLFLRSVCKISFFGQMQVVLAILLQGAFANHDSARGIDKLLGIISAISLCLSILIPVNFSQIPYSYTPIFSFQQLFELARIVFIVITLLAMFLSPVSRKYIDAKLASIGFFTIGVSYLILIKTMTLVSFLIGVVLLVTGTIYFLKHLYKYYMWK